MAHGTAAAALKPSVQAIICLSRFPLRKKKTTQNTTCTVIHEFLGLVVTSFAQHIWSNVDGTKLHYLQVDGIFPILIRRLLVFLLPETARLTKPLKPNCLTRLGHLPSCPVGGTILTQMIWWCHSSFNRIKFPAQNFSPPFSECLV